MGFFKLVTPKKGFRLQVFRNSSVSLSLISTPFSWYWHMHLIWCIFVQIFLQFQNRTPRFKGRSIVLSCQVIQCKDVQQFSNIQSYQTFSTISLKNKKMLWPSIYFLEDFCCMFHRPICSQKRHFFKFLGRLSVHIILDLEVEFFPNFWQENVPKFQDKSS